MINLHRSPIYRTTSYTASYTNDSSSLPFSDPFELLAYRFHLSPLPPLFLISNGATLPFLAPIILLAELLLLLTPSAPSNAASISRRAEGARLHRSSSSSSVITSPAPPARPNVLDETPSRLVVLFRDRPERCVEDRERYWGRTGRVNLSSSGMARGPEMAARREVRRLVAQVEDWGAPAPVDPSSASPRVMADSVEAERSHLFLRDPCRETAVDPEDSEWESEDAASWNGEGSSPVEEGREVVLLLRIHPAPRLLSPPVSQLSSRDERN